LARFSLPRLICRRANSPQAFSLVTSGKSPADFRASRARYEGRFAIVTKRWARDAVDAMAHETNALVADGEVVASRYPDAGIKFAVIAAGDGGNKARLSEETTKEPVKTTRAGNAG
jgi:hypothetical protein